MTHNTPSIADHHRPLSPAACPPAARRPPSGVYTTPRAFHSATVLATFRKISGRDDMMRFNDS